MPRLTIARQLSLLIAGAVTVAVVAVGGVSVWNLQNGFRDYLQARDEDQLNRLVTLIEQHATEAQGMEWLRDREGMRALMDEFNGRRLRGGPPPSPDGQRPPPPPASAPMGNLAERIVVLDREGKRIGGRPQPPSVRKTVRAIKVQGQEVAFVELSAEPEPEGVDARFLQHQTRNLLLAGAITIALALAGAWWIAGQWSRPLRALQRTTREIAKGKRPQPLAPTGALEIAQLMEDVNAMTADLARLENARRLWIAQISHELRTPLSVLRGEMEAIEDGAREATPSVMASLRDEVLQLNRLVDDLHTLSVADIQGLPCQLTDGDANALFWKVAQRFGPLAQAKGLALRLPPQSDRAIAVVWDLGRMEQLLVNLLTNSVRYTHAPGVVLVDWRVDAGMLTLTIEDSAPAVSAADLPLIFEPLFRADRARQRDTTGTAGAGSGLGLSIVRSIVQAHQGQVSATASALGGLKITVRLPLHAKKVNL